MVWYTNQSLLLILLAFLLGLLVGYLLWGWRLRRVRSSESAAEPVAAASPAAAPVEAPVEAPAVAAVTAVAAEPVAEAALVEPEPAPVAVVETEIEPEPEVRPESEAEPAIVDAALVAEVESAFAAAEPPVEEPADESVGAEEPAVEEPVAQEVAAEAPAADELERIEGIGPKIAAALRAAGITTFAQLADADRSAVETALENANLRFAPSIATWSRQARLLADGDEAGFKELTDRLIAGREVAAKAAAEPESFVEEPVAEPEPEVEEPVAAEPEPEVEPEEPAAAEPEPVVEEPEAVEEPAAVEAEPVVEEPVAVAAEPVAEEPADEPVAEEAAPVVVPAQGAAVEDGPVDDLKRIEGIGPKMSAALVAAGIRTYAQLADADVDTLRSAIETAGLRFAPSIVTWARQARHLADGDEEGFADLTRRLVAGRDTGRA